MIITIEYIPMETSWKITAQLPDGNTYYLKDNELPEIMKTYQEGGRLLSQCPRFFKYVMEHGVKA